jgi:hypothetical protein
MNKERRPVPIIAILSLEVMPGSEGQRRERQEVHRAQAPVPSSHRGKAPVHSLARMLSDIVQPGLLYSRYQAGALWQAWPSEENSA